MVKHSEVDRKVCRATGVYPHKRCSVIILEGNEANYNKNYIWQERICSNIVQMVYLNPDSKIC